MSLADLLVRSAELAPSAEAVVSGTRRATYAELDQLADRFSLALRAMGVGRGDRVGLFCEKSIAAIAAMQGALRLGAAYVPIDPASPLRRAALIAADCDVAALVVDAPLRAHLAEARDGAPIPLLRVDLPWNGVAWDDLSPSPPERGPRVAVGDDDLAYVLYTSGSTGRPKGVALSHRNALSFVHGMVELLEPSPNDRLSNHAPFHFDLSVLDLYVSLAAGATVIMVPEGTAYAPRQLVELVAAERITIWYSVPSALGLMLEHGGLADEPPPSLRAILFAGEPFPLAPLRRLRGAFPNARLVNLYGPTETNVCTLHEVVVVPESGAATVPIGRACCGDQAWAVREDGARARAGEVGELFVSGPTVMLGYFGEPPRGAAPYATGDLVEVLDDEPSQAFRYVGRRDQMVKVRGHRVELAEIEGALLEHPAIGEAAAAVVGEGAAAKLVAFVVPRGPAPPPLLDVKRHCAERLPRYMIVDDLRALAALPRTPNGKLDRRALAERDAQDGR